jgi:predicted transcriptional regulator
MMHIHRITNADKVILALVLEEGKAKVEELQFHLILTKRQIRRALDQLVEQGAVICENASNSYSLVTLTGLSLSD